jgi:hypothetical protein
VLSQWLALLLLLLLSLAFQGGILLYAQLDARTGLNVASEHALLQLMCSTHM